MLQRRANPLERERRVPFGDTEQKPREKKDPSPSFPFFPTCRESEMEMQEPLSFSCLLSFCQTWVFSYLVGCLRRRWAAAAATSCFL